MNTTQPSDDGHTNIPGCEPCVSILLMSGHRADCLQLPSRSPPDWTNHKAAFPMFTTARFLLVGKPLPRVEDSLRIGELLRWAVMSAFGKDEAGRYSAPPIFSGHDLPQGNRHQHAFYLPYDSSGHGYLNRAVIHVPAGFSGDQRLIIGRLRKIWQRDGGKWRLILEGIGGVGVGGSLVEPSREWTSVTPYLHPWHAKNGFTVEDQIRRECGERGFPKPLRIERLPSISIGGRDRYPLHFHRIRARRGLSQPDRHGSFWQIEFSEPIGGPLALGFGCHFGLGMFVPQ
ncbi:MAG: type I-U CRISPR-associated protein Csb2 [Gammaproteobacteria bacterium]|nr:type I-U CRISPR-associated protein Csb2 [Gammaproteobacteria bacterium]